MLTALIQARKVKLPWAAGMHSCPITEMLNYRNALLQLSPNLGEQPCLWPPEFDFHFCVIWVQKTISIFPHGVQNWILFLLGVLAQNPISIFRACGLKAWFPFGALDPDDVCPFSGPSGHRAGILLYIILHYVTLSFIILHYFTIHYFTLSYTILQYFTLFYNILKYFTLSYTILHYFTIF